MMLMLLLTALMYPTYLFTLEEDQVPSGYLRPWSYEEAFVRHSRDYGVPEQRARDIIWCESRGKAEARNYQAVVGVDIGYWQLNSYYWEVPMAERGWDIYNPEHNLEAGFWLYSVQGSDPWNWSAHCWGP